jgi:hypothetical protein
MDAPLDLTSAAAAADDAWSEEFCRSLSLEHGRIRDFLAARRQRLRQTEVELVRQIERLAGQLQAFGQRGLELASQRADQPVEAAGYPPGAGDQPDPEGLFRRYEMALCDLRELKARHADLQKHLAEVEKDRSQVPAPGGVLDWETEKRRILAALEASEELHEPEAGPERLQIQEIVAQTQRLLAEKDRQIEELRKAAENSASGVAASAAREKILDQDVVVREERESLRRLQDEWRDKLRQAEVDLSVQRAKLARQEAQINEKLRRLQPSGGPDAQAEAPRTPEKPLRGRWLSLLGLAGDDPPPSKR